MKKSNAVLLLILSIFFLQSCGAGISTNIKPVESTSVSLSFADIVGNSVEGSEVKSISAYDDFWYVKGYTIQTKKGNYLKVYGNKSYNRAYGKVLQFLGQSMIRFDLSSIPKDSFIASGKLGLYTIRDNDNIYDEFLGNISFFERPQSNNPNPTNQDLFPSAKINAEVDFQSGWYIVDITQDIAKKIENGETDLSIILEIDRNALEVGRFQSATFASTRMGAHVAPILLVEYAK